MVMVGRTSEVNDVATVVGRDHQHRKTSRVAYVTVVVVLLCGLLAPVGAGAVEARAPNGACRPGIGYPVAAGNASGEVLSAWALSKTEGEICQQVATMAAVGSTKSGFQRLGVVSSSSGLAEPTGVALDSAGDGWVVGGYLRIFYVSRYGIEYALYEPWAAFRPAGGSFEAPVDLTEPAVGGEPMVAENAAGMAVIVWYAHGGSYVAWATPTGEIMPAKFFGGGFSARSVSVDEDGRALVVGEYPSQPELCRWIAITSAADYGEFHRLHVVVRAHNGKGRWPKRSFSEPVIGTAPNGRAVVAYSEGRTSRRGRERERAYVSVRRRPGGSFTRPRSLRDERKPRLVDVSNAGDAVVFLLHDLRDTDKLLVGVHGEVIRRTPIHAELYTAQLASNASGRAIFGWMQGSGPLVLREVAPSGVFGPVRAIGMKGGDYALTMDAAGEATVLWTKTLGHEDSLTSYDNRLYARSMTPGARPVEIASGEEQVP